jgi:hypothetical protein
MAQTIACSLRENMVRMMSHMLVWKAIYHLQTPCTVILINDHFAANLMKFHTCFNETTIEIQYASLSQLQLNLIFRIAIIMCECCSSMYILFSTSYIITFYQ